jgi:hypothetical protein
MSYPMTRRGLLSWIPAGAAGAAALSFPGLAHAQSAEDPSLAAYFPAGDPKKATDTVLYAHSQIEKVAMLLEGNPELANAAIDWGFGDWESAIGAAGHMGRRDMAELLLANGARPDLFTHTMLGHVDVVRAMVEAQPGIQGTLGPHGFTMMFHARAGKEQAASVVDYLESVGGADPKADLADLPLPGEAYAGVYWYGTRADDVINVDAKDGRLRLGGAKGFPRNLFHTGDNRFYPGGAPSVSVVFRIQGNVAVECIISGAAPILTAVRPAG